MRKKIGVAAFLEIVSAPPRALFAHTHLHTHLHTHALTHIYTPLLKIRRMTTGGFQAEGGKKHRLTSGWLLGFEKNTESRKRILVASRTGEEVVNDHDVMALHHELIHQVAATPLREACPE